MNWLHSRTIILFFFFGNLSCLDKPSINAIKTVQPYSGKYKLTENPSNVCEVQNPSLNLLNLTAQDYPKHKIITKGEILIQELIPDYLSVQALHKTFTNFPNHDLSHLSFQAYYGNIPVCGSPIRAHLNQDNISLSDYDKFSGLVDSLNSEILWPEKPDINKILLEDSSSGDIKNLEITNSEKCLYINEQKLVPAWQFWGFNDQGKYTGFVNNSSLLHKYSTDFGASGLFQVYEENIDSEETIDVKVDNIADNGYLCSQEFLTLVELEYDFLDESTYDEVTTIFANAHRISKKISDVGGGHWSKVQVLLHIPTSTVNASPQFLAPGSGWEKFPTIYMPRNFQSLVNLRTDLDVLAHEYGHYLVYKTLRDIYNWEGRSIHEGFADFIAYMINGDHCLAESIVSGCLRTGNNSLHVDDIGQADSFNYYSFGELISGMLWDIVEDANWTFEDGLLFIVNAIEHLTYSSDFEQMINALLRSEKELFQEEYSCVIFENARERGFSSSSLESLDISCN